MLLKYIGDELDINTIIGTELFLIKKLMNWII